MISTVEGWLTALSSSHEWIAYAAGIVSLLLGIWLVWRWWSKGEAHNRVGIIAMVLATAFAAEGMWEVARESLGLDPVRAVALFAMFEVVMVHQGLMARYKMHLRPARPVRRHLNVIWAVAAASGVVSSLNSANVAEFMLRLLAPLVAATIFWMDLTADKEIADPSKITMRYTLRGIAVRLGLAEPGTHGLQEATERRRKDKMALLAHKLHNGNLNEKAKAKILAKLAKMSMHVSDTTVKEVQRRVSRASRIEKLTHPAVIDTLTDPMPTPPADMTAPVLLLGQPEVGLEAVIVPDTRASGDKLSPGAAEREGEPATVVASPQPSRAVAPSVPRSAAAYRQWLDVWVSMQAEPGVVNKVLATQHNVAERTITAIRRAGREGLLTDERCRKLEQMISAGTSQVPRAEFRAPVPAAALDADETAVVRDSSVDEAAGQTTAWQPVDAVAEPGRQRDRALVS